MFNAIKSVRAQTPFCTFSPSLPNKYQIIGTTRARVRFAQAVSGSNQPNTNSNKMDHKQETETKTEDMSSYGDGYTTRCDEEGFGGIYGRNQNLSKEDEDKIVHGNAPEYDESQGSEVNEKEKGRNQKKKVSIEEDFIKF